jgi:putative sporulation protein YyaC
VVILTDNTVYYDSGESLVQWKLNDALYRLIIECGKADGGISIICIGTDRSTGDSYGPLTGHMLSKIAFCDFELFGTFKEPVHALTLSRTLERIDLAHSLVIAVDASVGSPEFVGHIGMSKEPIKPGSGLGKNLPSVGDISITGIAAVGGSAPFLMLQNASLGLIYNMAEKTFFAIQAALYRLRLEKRLPDRKITHPVQSARA